MSDQQPQANNTQQPHDQHALNEDEARKQPILESASATNSPDNHSGVGPYIIVGIVLAVLVALALALCNLVEAAGTAIDWADGGSSFGYDDRDYSDLDDFFNDLDEFDGLGSSGASGQDLTSDNALDQYLGCIEYTVSDYVFASDYSGSQQAVATYVKALASRDASSAAEVKSHLRAAAATGNDATRASELQAAADAAASASEAIEALELPAESSVTGTKAADIIENLTDARDDALTRWNKIAQVIDMVTNPSGHTTRELSDLDDEASEVTDIALELTHALGNSASCK